MPSEASPPGHVSPTRNGSSEQDQRPLTTGGVRGLLGLPTHASGVRSTAPLTAPPRGHHYGQPPLFASGKSAEGLPEGIGDVGLSEEGERIGVDSRSDVPGALPRGGAALPHTRPENPAETRSTSAKTPVEHREQTSFVIPGVSTHKTEFTALFHPANTEQVTPRAAAPATSPAQVAPLHAPALLPHARTASMVDGELLSRLAHLVTDGAQAQHGVAAEHPAVVSRSPSPVEQMGIPREERGDTPMARQLAQLQHTVSALASTVAAQAIHTRDESQAQTHGRMTPPQRTVVVQRVDASSTTPGAFWERSRLGRLHLRTGR